MKKVYIIAIMSIIYSLFSLNLNSYAEEDCSKYNEQAFIVGYINGITKQLCRTSNSLEALEKQGVKTKISLFGRK